MRTLTVKNLENGVVEEWTMEQVLDEINRDRSDDWIDYDFTDWIEGWDNWVYDYYELLETNFSNKQLTETEEKYLKAFQGNYHLGEFESLIVRAYRVADLSNQRALAKGFPEIAIGYELWISGDYQ